MEKKEKIKSAEFFLLFSLPDHGIVQRILGWSVRWLKDHSKWGEFLAGLNTELKTIRRMGMCRLSDLTDMINLSTMSFGVKTGRQYREFLVRFTLAVRSLGPHAAPVFKVLIFLIQTMRVTRSFAVSESMLSDREYDVIELDEALVAFSNCGRKGTAKSHVFTAHVSSFSRVDALFLSFLSLFFFDNSFLHR